MIRLRTVWLGGMPYPSSPGGNFLASSSTGGCKRGVTDRLYDERTVVWFQRQQRRLIVRWARLAACFNAFRASAMMYRWVHT
jgi:hypothetical protein